MRSGLFVWIRRHPIRMVVYLLFAVASVIGISMVGGILSGSGNELLSAVVQSRALRYWAERHLHVHYSIGQIKLVSGERDCGLGLDVYSMDVALLARGGGRAEIEELLACTEMRAAISRI